MLERTAREYAFTSKSEAMQSAVRLYVSLLGLKTKDRLKMLQVVNELIVPSARTSGESIEEQHREEDRLWCSTEKPFEAASVEQLYLVHLRRLSDTYYG